MFIGTTNKFKDTILPSNIVSELEKRYTEAGIESRIVILGDGKNSKFTTLN